MKKNTLLTMVVVPVAMCLGLISGCSPHKNVLLTANKVEAAKFIVAAETYAIVHGKISGFVDSGLYSKCFHDMSALDNPFQKVSQHRCSDFLDQMVDYAKTTKNFKSVTVSDLKNYKVFPRLEALIYDFEDTEGDPGRMNLEEKKLLKGRH